MLSFSRLWDNTTKLLQANRRAFAVGFCALVVVILGGTAVALSGGGTPLARPASPMGTAPNDNQITTSTPALLPGQTGGAPAGSPTTNAANPATKNGGSAADSANDTSVTTSVAGAPNNGVAATPQPGAQPSTGQTTVTTGLPANNQPSQTPQSTPAVTVESTSSSISTYTATSFAALAPSSSGAIKSVAWDFGDGVKSSVDATTCDSPARATASHSYRAAGTYTVTATVSTGTRCGVRGSDATVSTRTSVIVNSGILSSNGPLFPTVVPTGRGVMPEDPHVVIQAIGGDLDGYVSQITFDWDEPGSDPTVIQYPLSSCSDSRLLWPSSTQTTTADHDYTNAGTYRVTVTVNSVGCDGQSSQQAIGYVDVTAGGTATSSTSSSSAS